MECRGIGLSARTAFCALILVMTALRAEDPLPIGGGTTEARNQSKLWHHACSWWSVLPDGADNVLFRWDGQEWDRQFVVDPRLAARADCLADGDDLYVLTGHRLETRLYKYRYDPETKGYDAVSGFPVALPIGAGGLRAVLAKDSTNKLWVTFIDGSSVKVVWSRSADHRTWDTAGAVIGTGVRILDDMSSIVPFAGNRIGVFYSDGQDNIYRFVVHEDGDDESDWQAAETAATGTVLGDDHVSLATSPHGDVYAAIKDKHNWVHILHRDPDAGWSAPTRVAHEGTRPHLVYDRFEDELYYFYTLNDPAPARLMYRKAPGHDVDALATTAPTVFIAASGVKINDVTSTKQYVDNHTGLLGTASGGGLAYSTWLPLGGSGPSSGVSVRVNFQPGDADVPADYVADDGSRFDADRGYGWSDRLTSKERGVNADQRRDTYVQVANVDGPVDWEYELPNGAYTVTLVSGSPAFTGRHSIELEGENVIDDVFTSRDFVTVEEHRVSVEDGRLTMTMGDPGIGTKKSKICFIDITGVGGSCFRRLHATALASTVGGPAPLTVDFTGEATSPSSTVESVAWDFGDGDVSTETHPTHTFTAPGVYDVSFTATDAEGNSAEATVRITVAGNVTATASADRVRGPAPLAVAFTGTANSPNGPITQWSWAFGDGATSTAQNPAHVYTAAGVHNVSVQATDATGAAALAELTITVLGDPTVTAAVAASSGDAPFSAEFTGTGSSPNGPITAWAWDFGDGGTADTQNPGHTFTTPGTYTVRVAITDSEGRTATGSVAVTVNEPAPPPPAEDPPADDPPIGNAVVARINFQPPSAPVPADYETDTGAKFSSARGYGWSKSLPNKERRTHPDARMDTYVYVSNTAGPVEWEYALPNGSYAVTLVAGSPAWSGIHHVEVEGEVVIDGVATNRSHVEVNDHQVTVTDGRLTVTLGNPAIGRKKSKICFLVIRRLDG